MKGSEMLLKHAKVEFEENDLQWLIGHLDEKTGRLGDPGYVARCRRLLLALGAVPTVEDTPYERKARELVGRNQK